MAQTGRSVSLERLQQILPVAYDNYQLLIPAMELMVQYRIESLSQLNRVAKGLKKRHRDGNIVQILGSATFMAGAGATAAGIVLAPLGAGLLLMAGGAAVAGIGTTAAIGAHVAEKVFEKVDLEKVQQAVDRDRAQCERVQQLWKEFDSYSVDVINTIALADPFEESDIASLQTWVQVAMKEVLDPVILIAETFDQVFSRMKNGLLNDPDGLQLCVSLGKVARKINLNPKAILRSIVSMVQRNYGKIIGTAVFLVIAAIGVGNLLNLIVRLIDLHKGSPSKIAKELCEKSSQLQEELDKWLDAFGKT
jgi:hypothetical protein